MEAAKEHAFRMYGLAGQTAVVTGGTKVQSLRGQLIKQELAAGARLADKLLLLFAPGTCVGQLLTNFQTNGLHIPDLLPLQGIGFAVVEELCALGAKVGSRAWRSQQPA